MWSGEDIVLYGPCVLELGIVWVLSGPWLLKVTNASLVLSAFGQIQQKPLFKYFVLWLIFGANWTMGPKHKRADVKKCLVLWDLHTEYGQWACSRFNGNTDLHWPTNHWNSILVLVLVLLTVPQWTVRVFSWRSDNFWNLPATFLSTGNQTLTCSYLY